MALIPRGGDKPQKGYVGTWANMEEDNAQTAFAASSFAAGVPVTYGSVEGTVTPLTSGNRFAGIALANVDMAGTPLSDGTKTFGANELLGVADMGCVFVLAGAGVVKGAPAFYEVATRKFHGTSATGRLILTDVEFDESAANGAVVPLRIRITPGAAVVAAAT